MKCPNCGKEIANDSLFCEFCGTQVASSKNVAQEASVHVRWLLFVITLFLCLFNVFVFYQIFMDDVFEEYSHFDTSLLWIVPAISLILFIIGLILSVKKKLNGIYTIMLFLIFGINTLVPISAEENKWSSIDYIVSISLYDYGTLVGSMDDNYFNHLDDAQQFKQVFTNMVNSSYRKYSGSCAQYRERSNYRASIWYIEKITYIYWFADGLIMLIYLIIASVASIKEKKKTK